VNIIELSSLVDSLSVIVNVVDKVAVAEFPVQLPELPLASPVTLPVNAPANSVAVNRPELELNSKLLPVFGSRSPVAIHLLL